VLAQANLAKQQVVVGDGDSVVCVVFLYCILVYEDRGDRVQCLYYLAVTVCVQCVWWVGHTEKERKKERAIFGGFGGRLARRSLASSQPIPTSQTEQSNKGLKGDKIYSTSTITSMDAHLRISIGKEH
jgi:hypothetical protein